MRQRLHLTQKKYQKIQMMIKRKLSLFALAGGLFMSTASIGQIAETEGADVIYDITYSMLMSDDVNGLEHKWFSNGQSASLMGEFSLSNNFAIGLGGEVSTYFVHNNLNFTQSESDELPEDFIIDADSSYNANEQNFYYVDVPLELRFRTNPNANGKSFHVTVGTRFGYRIGSLWGSRVFESSYHRSDDYAIRQYRNLGDDRVRIQGYARVGYGNFALFGGLDLLPVIALQTEANGTAKFGMASFGVSFML